MVPCYLFILTTFRLRHSALLLELPRLVLCTSFSLPCSSNIVLITSFWLPCFPYYVRLASCSSSRFIVFLSLRPSCITLLICLSLFRCFIFASDSSLFQLSAWKSLPHLFLGLILPSSPSLLPSSITVFSTLTLLLRYCLSCS